MKQNEQPAGLDPATGRGFDDTERSRVQALEAENATLRAQLRVASRQEGMADLASGALHNVGNVLNSVNVSVLLLKDRLRQSRVGNLVKALGLLREHKDDLARFLLEDAQGKLLAPYLETIAEHLVASQAELLREVENLEKNIDHVKEIVAVQQRYWRHCGTVETLCVAEVVEDAIRMNLAAFGRHRVELVREFEEVPPVSVEKHKILQILNNLLRNAKYALDELAPPAKRITIGISVQNQTVTIRVSDNGIGIAPENLARLFEHGFTTKPDGHGLGLHSAAQTARDMGGRLTVSSDGIGNGASFRLELPANSPTMPASQAG